MLVDEIMQRMGELATEGKVSSRDHTMRALSLSSALIPTLAMNLPLAPMPALSLTLAPALILAPALALILALALALTLGER